MWFVVDVVVGDCVFLEGRDWLVGWCRLLLLLVIGFLFDGADCLLSFVVVVVGDCVFV